MGRGRLKDATLDRETCALGWKPSISGHECVRKAAQELISELH